MPLCLDSLDGFRGQSPERHSFSDLKSACDHVVATWLKLEWRRLPRDEAKRWLATSRKAGISEHGKLEILEEYLVYEEAADIHEAIRNGESCLSLTLRPSHCSCAEIAPNDSRTSSNRSSKTGSYLS